MPVWFRAQGLSGTQMTIIFAAPMFARTVAGPGLAIWADGFRLRRTPMIWLAAGAAVSYASLGLLHGFWRWLVAWFLGTTMLGVLSPLTDVITLRRARLDGFGYGLPRGVGSAGYVLGNVGMGVILLRAPPVTVLIWTVAAASLTALGGRLWLPADPVREGTAALERRDLIGGLGALFRQPVFLLAIASVGLIQASHGFYYSFSTLVWRRQGVPEGWIGLLWGFGVGAEVLFMWFLEPWRRSVGPERLLVIGGLGAMVRWTAFAFQPALWLLFPLQALHALSFTATFMASLRLVERLSPPENASAAQTLNSSISGGLLTGLATVASGPLFDAWGAKGYLAMTFIAGLGVAGGLRLALRPSRA
ncbi:MAG TPA: MFS transporter [Caulobacteraceae bacterium]|jgi:PPP family 3-phenylpropionic acid transporter|nr:MFS transporter [Caulobacteraceae bacterium]